MADLTLEHCVEAALMEAQRLLERVQSHLSWRGAVLERPIRLARLEAAQARLAELLTAADASLSARSPGEALEQARVLRDSAARLLAVVEGWQARAITR